MARVAQLRWPQPADGSDTLATAQFRWHRTGATVLAGFRAKSALVLGDCGSPHLCGFPETGALFAMQDTRWDQALTVTGGGTGLAGHAGAVLLRKAADQAGLTAGLSAALRKAGTSPLLDRGIVLVSMAAAIALGATSMSDIAVLAHLAPVCSPRSTRGSYGQTAHGGVPAAQQRDGQGGEQAGQSADGQRVEEAGEAVPV